MASKIYAWIVFIFGLTALIYNAPSQASNECEVSGAALPVELRDSQLITKLELNGQETEFVVDTGAWWSNISNAKAKELGLKPRILPNFYIAGVGGRTEAEVAKVSTVKIAGIEARNIEFVVAGTDLQASLLGDNLLMIGDLDVDASQGKFNWIKVKGCQNKSFAYWATDGIYQTAPIFRRNEERNKAVYLTIKINGKNILALLDSGAASTVLFRHAADKIGFDEHGPGVTETGIHYGVGEHTVRGWKMPIDRMEIGTEVISHTAVSVVDQHAMGDEVDMLLGIDFFLSHHLYIANSQHKLYMTYNGGRMFSFAKPPKATLDKLAAEGEPDLETAQEYYRRGDGHLSKGELNAAQQDLNKAIAMDPDRVEYLKARIRLVRSGGSKFGSPEKDINHILELSPRDMDALLMRAAHYYSVQQIDDARADMATAQSMVAPYSVSARLIADQYSEYFDYRLALPIYEAWLKEHLDDAFRPTVLARVCFIDALFNQNLKAALKENSRLLKHAPDDPRILQSQAFLLMRLGSYSDAQSLFNKALSAANQKGWVWSDIGLAIIAKQNHDPEAASLALAHALKKVPRIIEIAQLYQLDLSDVPLPNLPQTP